MRLINDPYKTTDLPVAAFLVAKGAKLTRVQNIKRSDRVEFVFETGQKPYCEEMAMAYMNDAQVGAREFAAAMRDMKAMARGRKEE